MTEETIEPQANFISCQPATFALETEFDGNILRADRRQNTLEEDMLVPSIMPTPKNNTNAANTNELLLDFPSIDWLEYQDDKDSDATTDRVQKVDQFMQEALALTLPLPACTSSPGTGKRLSRKRQRVEHVGGMVRSRAVPSKLCYLAPSSPVFAASNVGENLFRKETVTLQRNRKLAIAAWCRHNKDIGTKLSLTDLAMDSISRKKVSLVTCASCCLKHRVVFGPFCSSVQQKAASQFL